MCNEKKNYFLATKLYRLGNIVEIFFFSMRTFQSNKDYKDNASPGLALRTIFFFSSLEMKYRLLVENILKFVYLLGITNKMFQVKPHTGYSVI